MTDDEARIRTLIERWAEAVHAGDLDGVLADHSPDIVMFDVPPPSDGVRGIDAYRATWPPFFEWQRKGAVFEIVALDVTAGDEVAFAHALLRCGTPSSWSRTRATASGSPSVCVRRAADGLSRTSTTRSPHRERSKTHRSAPTSPPAVAAAGEAPGEVAPHRGSVNIHIIHSKRAEPATGLRGLCNESEPAQGARRLVTGYAQPGSSLPRARTTSASAGSTSTAMPSAWRAATAGADRNSV